MLLGGFGRRGAISHPLLVLVVDLLYGGPAGGREEGRTVGGVVVVEQLLALQVEDEILDGVVVVVGEEGVAAGQGGQGAVGGLPAFVLACGPAVANEVLYVLGEILEINLVFCMAFINIIACQVNSPPLRGSGTADANKGDIVAGRIGNLCIKMGGDFK